MMKRRLRDPLATIGLAVLLVGSGPLIALILLDAMGFPVSDNPVGPGLLFLFSAPPGLILLLAGVLRRPREGPEAGAPRGATAPLGAPGGTLTPAQRAYIDGSSVGAAWGVFYFMFLGVTAGFFRGLPSNLIYTNVIANGRRQAWDEGGWTDFGAFRSRNDQIDRCALVVLAVGVPVVIVLLVM